MDKAYECMLVLRDDVSEEEQNEIFHKMIKKVESLGGKTLDSRVFAKDRQFYYPLRGRGAGRKKYFKGTYWLFNYQVDTQKLPELKEAMRLEERILRNLTLARDPSVEVAAVKE
jgi:ribosomal protein S6